MTFIKRLGIVTLWLAFLAGAVSLMAESRPPSAIGRALQSEMDTYVTTFTAEVGIIDASMQWVVMVLPVLEMAGPAITYGWLLPPKDRWVEGGPSIWIAMFTFHEDMMLMMNPRQRRVVAGHEVAHMMGQCMDILEPNIEGLDDFAALMLEFNYAVVLESCADIVSAGLTSSEDVLDTLLFLQKTWGTGNPVLSKRIDVMRRVVEREALYVE